MTLLEDNLNILFATNLQLAKQVWSGLSRFGPRDFKLDGVLGQPRPGLPKMTKSPVGPMRPRPTRKFYTINSVIFDLTQPNF